MRLFERPETGDKPPYITAGTLHQWSDRCAMLGGFTGKLSMRHQALIVRSLHAQGARYLFRERGDDNDMRVPTMFVPCPYEPLSDFLICDLDTAMQRADRRYPTAP
ncbi:MAG: hypothetical protein ABIQ60_15595 [Burkholderiaceae bacterium]